MQVRLIVNSKVPICVNVNMMCWPCDGLATFTPTHCLLELTEYVVKLILHNIYESIRKLLRMLMDVWFL